MYDELKPIVMGALQCRVCFQEYHLTRAKIDIAQVRWVGPRYISSYPKVLVVMINPCGGTFRKDRADVDMRNLLYSLREDWALLGKVFEHQVRDMRNWNHGRFWSFYVERMNLDMAKTAFANLAWCSTADNNYPDEMLNKCFKLHTERLVVKLQANVVLLSGSKVHEFEDRIKKILPNAKVVRILHYAHRKGYAAEASSIQEVRRVLADYGA
jgi:hypothetical protein